MIGSERRDPGEIWVECPHCEHQYDTHDAGDVRICPECGERFQTYLNVVEDHQ